MAYVTPDDIAQARQMDLLTYLQNYEPMELVKVSGSTYCTREHDSLKISNGKWYWFSRQIGGRSALDYLIHVKGHSLPQAVETILGRAVTKPPVSYKQKDCSTKLLRLPERSSTSVRVTAYLRLRGISPEIIDYCYQRHLVYESLPYHNAVFVGYDETGTPRYAALRSTNGPYKGEASGSDKHYSFSIPAESKSAIVHVCESAVDLLSFATMELQAGRNWRQDHLLSLAGVFKTKRSGVVPVALQRCLTAYPEIRTLYLHLDNDDVGRGATEGIIEGLGQQYEVINEPPAYGKDMNDMLLLQHAYG